MEQEIFKIALSQGPYAALFVGLLFYVLKQNQIREEKYQLTIEKNQAIIENLSITVNSDLTAVKGDIKEIKEKLGE